MSICPWLLKATLRLKQPFSVKNVKERISNKIFYSEEVLGEWEINEREDRRKPCACVKSVLFKEKALRIRIYVTHKTLHETEKDWESDIFRLQQLTQASEDVFLSWAALPPIFSSSCPMASLLAARKGLPGNPKGLFLLMHFVILIN